MSYWLTIAVSGTAERERERLYMLSTIEQQSPAGERTYNPNKLHILVSFSFSFSFSFLSFFPLHFLVTSSHEREVVKLFVCLIARADYSNQAVVVV